MKKQNVITKLILALFFAGLFLGANIVKAGNCTGTLSCSASQTCCNTGCCDNATQICHINTTNPALSGCVPITSGAGGVGAGVIGNPIIGNLGSQTGISFLQSFLPKAIGLAFVIGVVIFFFMLIMGAIKWISSGGDKQALENAKGTITNAIIGLVILFATFVIAKLIQTFFGFSILTLDIGSLII